MTQFNITMDTEDTQGKNILIFLKPENPEKNYSLHAWQVLNPPGGGTGSFDFEQDFGVSVIIAGEHPDTPIETPVVNVSPGDLLQAVTTPGSPIAVETAPPSLAREKLGPGQAGVINKTDPSIPFDCSWYVNGRRAVTQSYVNEDEVAVFQHEPVFYFAVTDPPLVGQRWAVRDLSDMTSYELPGAAEEVDVSVTNEGGAWKFDFKEK